jgi:hypothetical protein
MVGRLENQNKQEKYPSQQKFILAQENYAEKLSRSRATLERERARTAGTRHLK